MEKKFRTLLGIVLLLGIALMVPGVKALAETPSVAFSDVSSVRTNQGFTLSGILNFNGVPAEELNVLLFCNGVQKAIVPLNMLDGSFSLSSTVCYSNQEAYAQVMYKSEVVQSEHFKIPSGKSSRTASIAINPAENSLRTASIAANPTGVPEFSLLTIGAAILAVTLGIVILRKN